MVSTNHYLVVLKESKMVKIMKYGNGNIRVAITLLVIAAMILYPFTQM